jgi:hypothetical protein
MLPNRVSRCAVALGVLFAAFTLALTGCASQNVGSRLFQLKITTDPYCCATAYLIPNMEWLKADLSPTDPAFPAFVDRYKVTDGKTPVTVSAPAYQFRVVVKYKDRYFVAREPVVPGEYSSVNILPE